ncbi:hypothetical protein [Kitasatospora sp. NPDC098663]|uniref:hypothetical protein n=1 Tax=Kitasatospora sp. NPDC098663 TaxID=3364096 RepID=UPI00380358BD
MPIAGTVAGPEPLLVEDALRLGLDEVGEPVVTPLEDGSVAVQSGDWAVAQDGDVDLVAEMARAQEVLLVGRSALFCTREMPVVDGCDLLRRCLRSRLVASGA